MCLEKKEKERKSRETGKVIMKGLREVWLLCPQEQQTEQQWIYLLCRGRSAPAAALRAASAQSRDTIQEQ